MTSEPLLLHRDPATQDDLRLKRLVESFGPTSTTVSVSSLAAELERAADHDLCVLASATSVDAWCQTRSNSKTALSDLYRKAACLFIYGFTPDVSHTLLAASSSNGKIVNIQTFTGTGLLYHVSSLHPEITREFSGLSFGCVRNPTDFGFVCSEGSAGMVPLVTIEGTPHWCLVQRDGCQVFLLACSAVADLQEQVSGNVDVRTYFSRLLPAAMFLKAAFAGRCWHNKHRFANFIIDDPPLKRSYGHLNYRDLVSVMDRVGFASTIAFIPWNYNRCHADVTQLFRDRPDRLSLCVHGCDHTAAEFAGTDLAFLNSRMQLALARMNTLKRHNGIAYSKVMVFPQGHFSLEALTALKSNSYLAAVNSSSSPTCPNADMPSTLGDFLDPAISKYGGFPLYLRRYPAAPEQFAFDLFFGKPLLAVEHHAYLSDSGERLAKFIATLNSLEKLEWTSFRDIIPRTYLQREVSKNLTICKLFTNDHIIQNQADHERAFVLMKREAGDVPIRSVLLNGQKAAFQLSDEVLEVRTRIPARSSAILNIAYGNRLPAPSTGYTPAGRVRVWTRRMLSEFRDAAVFRKDFVGVRARGFLRGLSGRDSLKRTQENHVSS